jgi:hypothetical protein
MTKKRLLENGGFMKRLLMGTLSVLALSALLAPMTRAQTGGQGEFDRPSDAEYERPNYGPASPTPQQTSPSDTTQTQPGQYQNQPGLYQNQPGMMQNQPGQYQNQPGMMQNQPGMMQNQPGQTDRFNQPADSLYERPNYGPITPTPQQFNNPGTQMQQPGVQPSPGATDVNRPNQPYTVGVGRSQVYNYYETKPFELAYLAYQGYFSDQGISGYENLLSNYRRGTVSGMDIVEAAVTQGRISPERMEDSVYVSQVDALLRRIENNRNR